MNDDAAADPHEGIDPHPTPSQLIAQSVELDAEIERNKLVQQILADSTRQRSAVRLSLTLAALVAVVSIVLGIGLYKIAENTNALNREREARRVFCAFLNDRNAEAQVKFLELYAGFPNQAQLHQLADIAWPHIDCDKLDTAAEAPDITSLLGGGGTVPP